MCAEVVRRTVNKLLIFEAEVMLKHSPAFIDVTECLRHTKEVECFFETYIMQRVTAECRIFKRTAPFFVLPKWDRTVANSCFL